MKRSWPRRKVIVAGLLLGMVGISGCGPDPARHAIAESLATENPAHPQAALGPPPVRPEALAITPTGLPPTHAPAVSPQPILPRMDEAFKNRRFPPGVTPGTRPDAPATNPAIPATRPIGEEAPPDHSDINPARRGQNQSDRP